MTDRLTISLPGDHPLAQAILRFDFDSGGHVLISAQGFDKNWEPMPRPLRYDVRGWTFNRTGYGAGVLELDLVDPVSEAKQFSATDAWDAYARLFQSRPPKDPPPGTRDLLFDEPDKPSL